MKNRAQASLEFVLIFAVVVVLFAGMISIWKAANDRIIRRQVDYNDGRIDAGSGNLSYMNQGEITSCAAIGGDGVVTNIATFENTCRLNCAFNGVYCSTAGRSVSECNVELDNCLLYCGDTHVTLGP